MKGRKVMIICTIVIMVSVIFAGCSIFTPKEYKRGTITETGWESEYLNLRFTTPTGYIMVTAEQLDMMTGFDENTDPAQARLVVEMLTTTTNRLPNLHVGVEKNDVKEEEYLETSKSLALNKEDMSYTFPGEVTKLKVAGKTYKQLSSEVTIGDQVILQDLLVRKVDDRMVVITITYDAQTETEKDVLLGAFTKF